MEGSLSLIIYIFLTLAYFYLDYTLVGQWIKHLGKKKENTVSNILLAIWFILTLVVNFYFNVKVAKEKCGTSQVLSVFLYSFIPHLLILGLLIVVLHFVPSLLMPFSNTVGYALVANLGNVNNLFNQLFKTKKELELSGDNKYNISKIMDLISQIKRDKTIYINEITPNNFNNWINTFKQGGISNNTIPSDILSSLYNHVLVKEMISKATWLLLTGILIIQTSYNSIANLDCDRTNIDNAKVDDLLNEQINDNDEDNTEKWDLN